MALRAGYYGIKNALLKKLEALTNAVVIKSIGEGLDLSAAGELSNTSTGGMDYSTEEQNTGLKWTDGRDIYKKSGSLTNITMNELNTVITGVNADIVIGFEGSETWTLGSEGVFIYPINTLEWGSTGYNQSDFVRVDSEGNCKIFPRGGSGRVINECHVTVYYVKPVAESEELSATRNIKKSIKKTAKADTEKEGE